MDLEDFRRQRTGGLMESYKSYMPYSFPALGAFERPRASTLGGHTAVFKALKASTGTG